MFSHKTCSFLCAGLPFGKDLVDSKPALRGSNIPAIQLWQKPCWANLFDGQVAAGPIPVLLSQFTEDPDLIQVARSPAHNSKTILPPFICFLSPNFSLPLFSFLFFVCLVVLSGGGFHCLRST
jgi:hypothetical protein